MLNKVLCNNFHSESNNVYFVLILILRLIVILLVIVLMLLGYDDVLAVVTRMLLCVVDASTHSINRTKALHLMELWHLLPQMAQRSLCDSLAHSRC